nr:MAG TPA: hypothetical protein [Caudoviricetes sp.]
MCITILHKDMCIILLNIPILHCCVHNVKICT